MADEMAAVVLTNSVVVETVSSADHKKWSWPSWIPSSTDHIIDSEKRLFSLVKTPYKSEQISISTGPPGSKIRWFRSMSNKPWFINTVTFDSKDDGPTIVLVHGYGASLGFFFRNFDALAEHFRVIAIDQLGWGGSSRPGFTCKSTKETEAWFVDSFEEWRKAKNLDKFIILGHSFGGYVASKYALKHHEHVQHLILVGPAGFSSKSDMSEGFSEFKATWKGALLNHLWESNFTPQKLVRQAAKASGELCLKYIFSFGAFARKPLLQMSASEWKVPTSFIYGYQDWMNYRGAQEARKNMSVPCEIIRVPQAGHFVFIDKATQFHSAVVYASGRFLSEDPEHVCFPHGCTSA